MKFNDFKRVDLAFLQLTAPGLLSSVRVASVRVAIKPRN